MELTRSAWSFKSRPEALLVARQNTNVSMSASSIITLTIYTTRQSQLNPANHIHKTKTETLGSKFAAHVKVAYRTNQVQITAKNEETKITFTQAPSTNENDGLSMAAVASLKPTVSLKVLEKSKHAFLHNFCK